ncbi:MAG: hypothetical protein CMM39_07935 [Rhodospirillaceae bacterium]|nr:hypothetical protein [Rhodospirillaceae bacterium]
MDKRVRSKLSKQDIELFNKIVVDVQPLKKTYNSHFLSNLKQDFNEKSRDVVAAKKFSSTNTISRKTSKRSVPLADYSPGRAPGIDRNTSLRLRKGKMRIEYRLDLHGLSQKKARSALEQCIAVSRSNHLRSLLVITGKGRKKNYENEASHISNFGVLRRVVPQWLIEPPLSDFVLAFSPAQPEHGGSGAFYVLLRKEEKI